MDPTSSVKSFNHEVHSSLKYTVALDDRWTFNQGKPERGEVGCVKDILRTWGPWRTHFILSDLRGKI